MNVFTIIGYTIRYEHWCVQMIYMFYISVIFPNIIYLSGYSYHQRDKILKYINNFIISIFFIITFYFHIFFMAQSNSLLFLLLTSGNILCSIFIFIIVFIFKNKKKHYFIIKKIKIYN